MSERSDPALELLRDVSPSTPLSHEARRRIAERMQLGTTRTAPMWLFVAAPCAVAVALALLISRAIPYPQPSQSLSTQAFVVPACTVTHMTDERFVAALVGPASVAVDPKRVFLRDGRLIVRTNADAVDVAAQDTRVTVGPASLAEVEVRELNAVRVAVYQGTASVNVTTSTFAITAGNTWHDGAVHQAEKRAAENAAQILELTTNPAALCPAPSTVSATPPQVAPVEVRHRAHHDEWSTKPRVIAPVLEPPLVKPAPSDAQRLADAITQLRVDHDARGALAVLDAAPLDAIFANEVALVRVDALLALGERSRALHVLDSLPLPDVPRGEELLALRAEMRAAEKRSVEAANDLRDYLKRFPNGAFAVDARRLLARQP